MMFEEKKAIEGIGEKIGYVFGYFLFTTILFYVLALTNKIPENWSYFHIMAATMFITLTGVAIERLLK